MKTNIRSALNLLTNWKEKDVFKSTQGRLTRIFSGLIVLFLILFILIVYFILYAVILNSQEKDLQSLVSQEASFISRYYVENEQNQSPITDNQEVVFAGVNQYFYYVLGTNGKLLMGNETDSRLRPDLLSLVNEISNSDTDIQRKTLNVKEYLRKGRGTRGEFHPEEAAHQVHLLIARKAIYDKNGQYVGVLFIGKDISFAYQLFHWLLLVLIAIGVVFFGVALTLSVMMSNKAMLPIITAFKRQREFVADASHELRTPLSVLLSSVDAMEMTIEPDKDSPAGRMLWNMREEVKRLTGLVTDLLTLARSDSQKIELKNEKINFRILAEKTIESLRPIANGKELTMHLEAPPSLYGTGDYQKLNQLIYILVDNAIKYTPTEGDIALYLLKKEQGIEIRIQDTGIGIRKEELEHIFQRFYRVDKSRSRQIGGHGLGLSIAKWIVEAHKGTILAFSKPGEGSTFVVRIPQTQKE